MISAGMLLAAFAFVASGAAAQDGHACVRNCGAPISIEGRLNVGREFRLYDYRIIQSGVEIVPSSCLSGLFRSRRLLERAYNRFRGRRVLIKGVAIDYFQRASADPIAATVDALQNGCGNRHAVIAYSVEAAR